MNKKQLWILIMIISYMIIITTILIPTIEFITNRLFEPKGLGEYRVITYFTLNLAAFIFAFIGHYQINKKQKEHQKIFWLKTVQLICYLIIYYSSIIIFVYVFFGHSSLEILIISLSLVMIGLATFTNSKIKKRIEKEIFLKRPF